MLKLLAKGFGLFLLVVVLLGSVWGWQNRQHLAAFPDILPAYTAKEYCSCRFTAGYSADYCAGFTRQWLPLKRLSVDETNRHVTAEGMGRTHTARWLGERQGCQLQTP
ncbi:amidase [Atopomonas sediminilitoris]|uniref:amidase n=1 Tax=Atopomonas sediminilitoris TaxID=2919919 RepID=UPI001F4EE41C|nr:amidase [Atopomonas sediminilitoris]MCJ8168695.1 amidase [Atopomonas sediminilitoris]